jgi:hypothetical protein
MALISGSRRAERKSLWNSSILMPPDARFKRPMRWDIVPMIGSTAMELGVMTCRLVAASCPIRASISLSVSVKPDALSSIREIIAWSFSGRMAQGWELK